MKPVYFVIVNIDTNEINADCPLCGLFSGTGYDDRIDTYPIDEKHKIIEFTAEEYMQMNTRTIVVERKGEIIKVDDSNDLLKTDVIQNTEAKHEIDFEKAAKKLDERTIIEIPVFIDGPGGPEIAYIEEKPESIIKEKTKAKIK